MQEKHRKSRKNSGYVESLVGILHLRVDSALFPPVFISQGHLRIKQPCNCAIRFWSKPVHSELKPGNPGRTAIDGKTSSGRCKNEFRCSMQIGLSAGRLPTHGPNATKQAVRMESRDVQLTG